MMIALLLMTWLAAAPAAGSAARPADDVAACLASPQTLTIGTYVEEAVAFESGGVRLAGRVLLPNRPGPHPAVLVIPGGGRDDRINYAPRFLAARLARCGVAALVYDKRATGASEGDWAAATLDELTDDAVAALQVLRAHAAVDGERLGLIGLSQGGRLVPAVAAKTGAASFVVTIASPFVSVPATRRFAVEQALRKRGYGSARRDSLLALWDRYLDRIDAGRSTADLDAAIDSLPSFVPLTLRPPRSTDRNGGPVFNSWRYEADEALATLHVPFLALFAGDDDVVPVAASVEHLRAVLAAAGALDVLVIPGVDHSFTYPGWRRTRFRFEQVVTAWVLAQVGLLETCNLQLETLAAHPPAPDEDAAQLAYRPCTGDAAPNDP